MSTVELQHTLFKQPLSDKTASLEFLAREIKETMDAAISLTPQHAMNLVRVGLFFLRQKTNRSDWNKLVKDIVLTHPIRKIIHKDPFTYRAFSKPRGYAGDAVMIDYIYGNYQDESLNDKLTKAVFDVSTNSPSTRAVRNRLNYIVNSLNTLYESNNSPEVFSVACGHCREFELCDSFDFIVMDGLLQSDCSDIAGFG